MFGGIHFSPDAPDPDNITRMDLGCLPIISDMHRYGIRIDIPFLRSLSRKIAGIQELCEVEVSSAIGAYQYRTSKNAYIPFNIGSRDHLSQLLFEHLKIQGDDPVPMTEKGKRFEVSEEVLKPFEKRHPAVASVIEWHSVEKLRNTYVDALPLMVDSDSRLHTDFNVTIAATGRLSSSNPNCFDAETEVLTPTGWKYIRHLSQYVDRVAQWHLDGRIDFVVPEGYVQSYSSDLVEIHNQHIDLRVTSDHRCLLQNRKTGELRVFDAKSYPEDWKQIHAGDYSGPGSGLSEPEIDFMLAIQADGSWCVRKTTSSALDFSFRKARKIDRFKKLLKTLNIVHSFRETERRTRFYIPACPQTCKQLALLGPNKTFRWDLFLSMSAQELEAVCERCMFWDGCWTRNNYYASRNRQNAEVIAAVYSLRGRRAKIRKYTNQSGSVSWQVDVTNKSYSLTTNRKLKHSSRSGFVYCVSVPSSYLLVRRNNCTMVTGNCQNIPTRTALGKEIRKAFIADPGCDLVSSDLAQIEMVWAAHRSQDPTMLDVFHRKQDLHTRTACVVFNLDYGEMMALKLLVESREASPDQAARYAHFKQFQRLPCKNVGFGVLYGQTPEGLQISLAPEGIFWTIEQCKDFIENKFFAVYTQLRAMLDRDYSRALRYAIIWDDFGRVRLVPEAKSQFKRIRNEGIRKAGNHPEQCINPATQVFVRGKGMKAIGDLPRDSQQTLWDGRNWTTGHVVDAGEKKQLRIELNSGFDLYCSPDHKILVRHSDGDESWIAAEKLRRVSRNVRVVIGNAVRREWNWNKFPPTCSVYRLEKPYQYPDLTWCEELPSLFGEFLGRIASDGGVLCSSASRKLSPKVTFLLVAEHEKSILPRLKRAADLVSDRVRVSEFKKEDYAPIYRIEIYSRGLAELLLDWEIKDRVPEFVWKNSRILKGYLRGMFDGDGGMADGRPQVSFGGGYRKIALAKDVQQALLLFGIRARLKPYQKAIRLTVQKLDNELFSREIGFINTKKQHILDTEPEGTKGRNMAAYGRAVSVKRVDNLGFCPMVDFVNSSTERFCAGGIVVHNSGAQGTIKVAMMELGSIYRDINRSHRCVPVLQIHDQLIIVASKHISREVGDITSEKMRNATPLSIPIQAEPDIGERWGDL